MTDTGWIGELVKLGGSAIATMVPKIRKRALGVLAITKHSNNWPKGLQVRDYEMVAMTVALVCDKNACSGLLECADFSDVHLTGSDTETGICLTLIQEQPEALRRAATLCVYANMLGYGYMARRLLKRALAVTNEMREKLYILCETPARAWRVEDGLSQWALALETDIQSWMYSNDLPISCLRLDLYNNVQDTELAINDAYYGKWDTLQTIIEEHTNKMPKGITGLQFNVKSTGLSLWQERGLEQMIKDKNLAIQINADAQLWSMKVDTTNGFVGELQVPLSPKKLMQRYNCQFRMGIHICPKKSCKYQRHIKALLVCATLYRLLDILPKWLPIECIVGFVYSQSVLWKGTVADNLHVKYSFSDMCAIMQTIGSACSYSQAGMPGVGMSGSHLVVGGWAANMDIGNWATWFTKQAVGYAEIDPFKPLKAIKWMNSSQLFGSAKADIYTDSTPAGWWCVPWVMAGVPGLRVRKGVIDVLHIAFYPPDSEELEELHRTIVSNHDVPPKEVKSLLGFIREDKTSDRQIVAVDGNPSSRALVNHLARSAGVKNELISLSCAKELMDNDKYLIFTDNPNLKTQDVNGSVTCTSSISIPV
ncbi:hypothetical protein NQZ79_g7505 [Umbelopsis isabellina]|nr:hypothetical protein NQZ79_g7505 [Umbelopsis isabellina]